MHRRDPSRLAFLAAALLLAMACAGPVAAGAYDPAEVPVRAPARSPIEQQSLGHKSARTSQIRQDCFIEVAQVPDEPPRELEPRYQPVPPQEKSWYNDGYIFAATRGVADSTLVPAVKAPLYLLTVPLDLILLPFATIGGLFG